jgi:hypothetical protein
MDVKVSVAPDRAGEMGVVDFGQTIMTQRRRGVTCTLQTFEQRNLERMLFRGSPDRCE